MYHSNFSIIFSRGARLAAVSALALALLGLDAGPAAAITPGATITVNTTADDNTPNGNCTLREAILAANTNTAVDGCMAGTTMLDTIHFDTSVFSGNTTLPISNSTDTDSLPAIIEPVVITNNTGHYIFVQGWGGGGGDGFTFRTGSAGSVLDGLLIGNWGHDGVRLEGSSGKVTLINNMIGVFWDGTSGRGNGNDGIRIYSSNNVIGGLNGSGHARTNIISDSGNNGIEVYSGAHNTIQGNYIGTTADGMLALGNANAGIWLHGGAKTQVGGTLPHQGNVISGNQQVGMVIAADAPATTVQRNFFGVGADGVRLIGNHNANIVDNGGVGTLIGGPMPQAGNIIANSGQGIWLAGGTGTPIITGNLIGFNAHGEAAGNSGNGIILSASPTKVTITGNLISNNPNGINFQGTTPVVSITQNCITGNTNTGVRTTGGPESVAGNWWGVGTGPNTPGGDATSGSLTVDPWLTVPPSSCLGWAPKTISPKDQSFKNKSMNMTKFSWSPVSTANNYHFTLSNNPDLSSPFDDLDTGLVPSQIEGRLGYGPYYWKTTTSTADSFAWGSATHAFYVTTMTSPKPGAVLTSSTVTLKWLAYPGAADYSLKVWYDNADCSGSPGGSWGPIGTSLSVGFSGGPHSWWITPNVGGAPTMPCWSFTTP